MKPDRTEIAALSIAAFCGLVLPTKIVFSDIGLRDAVEDGALMRAWLYTNIGANPDRYNIPAKAYESGNCAMMQLLQEAGGDFTRLFERHGSLADCDFDGANNNQTAPTHNKAPTPDPLQLLFDF